MFVEKPHDECGVFGLVNNDGLDVAHEIYLALYALQHRGQLSCGICINHKDSKALCINGEGLVPDVFTPDKLAQFSENDECTAGIGHCRYSPNGFTEKANTQPFLMNYAKGYVSIANNGSLVNSVALRRELEADGAVFQTGSDAELIGYLVARERLNCHELETAVKRAMKKLVGSYSFVMLSPHKLVAVRDPNGFRPLCIGKISNSYAVSSESCAIQSLGGEVIRDVRPGEIVVINEKGLTSVDSQISRKQALCVFEHVYFARSDSVIDKASVHAARKRAGVFLAKEHPVEADVVIGVPDSGLDAALGYSYESGIPYEIGFIKNRYIGRTFIQDKQSVREKAVSIKLNPIKSSVSGKRVVMVDDSIVRGTTIKHLVDLVRNAGAKEVHLRISSPPFVCPCYFGTDISSKDQLIACRMSIDGIRQLIGADSLGYLSLEGLHGIARESEVDFCDACFTGDYPVEIPEVLPLDKFAIKLDTLEKGRND